MDTMEVSMLDMQTYFEERMSKFEAALQKKSSSETGDLAEEFGAFKLFVMNTLQSFSKQLQSLAREVDNLETRSRRKILLIHGVDEQKGEELEQLVVSVVKQRLQNDQFASEDIQRCHRMGRQSSPQKPRPILVKFQSGAMRDNIWFSKKKLKGSGVTVSEFLTRSRHKAFIAAREKFGVSKCWTREGCVYILDSGGHRHQITSLGDLGRIKSVEAVKPPVKTATTKSKRAATITKK